MASSRAVPISGSVLAWAREQDGLSQGDLALAVGARVDDVARWESGEAKPSRGQFSKLVRLLRRPSAVFFLPTPPKQSALPKSFRTAPGLAGHDLQQQEVRDVRWARRLQDITSWLLKGIETKAVALPKATQADAPEEAAKKVRQILRVSVEEQLSWSSPSEAFRSWREALEELGILVVQLSLGKDAVRGFSVWDDQAPLVAVNTAYHPTARVFTVFHELGHLVLRSDATCFRFVGDDPAAPKIERWCEEFAAHLLLPEQSVRQLAASAYGLTEETVEDADVETARLLSGRFKVSTRAMALRLQELRLAPPGFYRRVEAQLNALDWNSGGGGAGQTRVEKRMGQLGRRIPELILGGEERGRINRADVADYLKVTTGQVDDLRGLVRSGSGR